MVLNANNQITIREFVPEDLPQVTAVERSVYGSGAYSTYFFRQLHDLFPKLVWVAEDKSKLVGHVCGAVTLDGDTGWILNFGVLAHYRRQGIGRLLLEQCITHLEQAGVERIQVTSEPENDAAIRLLGTLGFEQLGVAENYYGEGLDRLIFDRSL